MARILVADENEQILALISKYLIDARYECITTQNGSVVVRKAKIFNPDLIVIDPVMLSGGGFDVCRTLKNDPDTKNIMILVIVTVDNKEVRTKAFEAGADDYLTKTFDKSLFLSKVKSLIRITELSLQLKSQYAALEEKNNMIESQLKIAQQVQRCIVQDQDLVFSGSSFCSRCKPALGLGGDVYDIIHIRDSFDDDVVLVMLSDVSGHGISSALLTAMVKMLFRTAVDMSLVSPEKILSYMNREFCKMFNDVSTQLFACTICAYIDLKNNIITCANAGQSYPIFIDSANASAREIEVTGTPLGILADANYSCMSFDFNKNDMVLFHTDGLCDFFYKDSPDEFVKRLKELLIDLNDDAIDAKEVVQFVFSEFCESDEDTSFTSDDVSVILCKLY